VVKSVTVESQWGELNLELTVKGFLAGYRMIEVLFSWRDRTGGLSQFRLWKWLPHYLG
jgi:dolichol-phosphate mannosyltransferase